MNRLRRLRAEALFALLLSAAALSGCGVVLGLGDFEDAQGAGGHGQGGGGTGGDLACQPDDEQACYDGPEGTRGVGLCKDGSQACGQDGTFGVCEGSAGPKKEDCEAPEDEDCDGVVCSAVLWAHGYDDAMIQYPTRVAVAPNGNIAITGLYGDGAANFGPDAATALPVPSDDLAYYVAVFDAKGDHLWSRAVESVSEGFPSVAFDAKSDLVMLGRFRDKVDLGGGSLLAGDSGALFLVKFDPAGVHLWSRAFPAQVGAVGASVYPAGIGTTAAGDVVIAGNFEGQLSLGGPLIVNDGADFDDDAFVAQLAGADGSHVWTAHMADPAGVSPGQDQHIVDIAVDGSDHVVAAGDFRGALDVGGLTVNSWSVDVSAGYVVELDASGNHAWHAAFRGQGECKPSSIAVGHDGNVVVAGSFNRDIAFEGASGIGPSRTTSGETDNDIFLVRLTSTGNHAWSKQMGDTTSQSWDLPLTGLAIDALGEVAFVGGFRGKADFGAGEVGANDVDWFVAKYDATGVALWSRRYGDGGAFQGATDVAVDPKTRELVMAGISDGSLALGDPPLAVQNIGTVLAKLSP